MSLSNTGILLFVALTVQDAWVCPLPRPNARLQGGWKHNHFFHIKIMNNQNKTSKIYFSDSDSEKSTEFPRCLVHVSLDEDSLANLFHFVIEKVLLVLL